MHSKAKSIVLCFVLLCAKGLICAFKIQDLDGVWNLTSSDSEHVNLKAKVPGGVYSDLMENKIIGDVFFGFNDIQTRWVATKDWVYSKNFFVDEELLNHENLNIVFNGLDTFAHVLLNNVSVGTGENMFVRYVFPIKINLHAGMNNIVVKFASPTAKAKELYEAQVKSYLVPPSCVPAAYNGECHVNHIRKMQASFAWDWGPAFPSVGIWKSVYIESYNSSVIRDVTLKTRRNDEESQWEIEVTTYFAETAKNVKGELNIKLFTDINVVETLYDLDLSSDDAGEYRITHKVMIPQSWVKLWWPNGLGNPNLYVLKVTYANLQFSEQNMKRFKIGFRTIQLIQSDIQDNGKTFAFMVNERTFFAKGSNVIPISILPERAEDSKKIKFLLQSAKDVNMNMLRVWGGGMYESDEFYRTADELGLLIWQDFMFACSMYPSSTDFLSTVKQEVKHQVRRLQHHASIAIWAGNNENEGALRQNWYGTSNNFSLYKEDYIKLYVDTIKEEVLRNDDSRDFLVSSPTNGVESEQEGYIAENPQSEHFGDMHYYNYVQNGWNKNVYPKPRFASEYGYQSLPSIQTLMKATNSPSDLSVKSAFLQHRQHHPHGYAEMEWMMAYEFDFPPSNCAQYDATFVYYSQIYQAMAVKSETEHYRSYMGRTTTEGQGWTFGALYWQLNDVWVAPTWSGIDFEQNWKMLHYFAKDFFAPIIATGHIQADRTLNVYVVNEERLYLNATVALNVYKWDSFEPIFTNNVVLNLLPISNEVLGARVLETDIFLSKLNCGTIATAKLNCFFSLEVSDLDKNSLAPINFVLPAPVKSLHLPAAHVMISSIEAVSNSTTFNIKVKTDAIALFVWLESSVRGRFSDNGFLQITAEKNISFNSERPIAPKELKKAITVTHLLNNQCKGRPNFV